jgi:hypothetical protein
LIQSRNALDPALSTHDIRSSFNFNKRFGWGSLSLGGRRTRVSTTRAVTQTLPSLTIRSETAGHFSQHHLVAVLLLHPGPDPAQRGCRSILSPTGLGGVDTIRATSDTRLTSFTLDYAASDRRVQLDKLGAHGRSPGWRPEDLTFKIENPNTPGIPTTPSP